LGIRQDPKGNYGLLEKNRAAILAASNAQCQKVKQPFRRPYPYLDEIAAQHPRKKVGSERWWWPQFSPAPRVWHVDPIYENDEQYLKRLNLLKPWEKQHGHKKKTKNTEI